MEGCTRSPGSSGEALSPLMRLSRSFLWECLSRDDEAEEAEVFVGLLRLESLDLLGEACDMMAALEEAMEAASESRPGGRLAPNMGGKKGPPKAPFRPGRDRKTLVGIHRDDRRHYG